MSFTHACQFNASLKCKWGEHTSVSLVNREWIRSQRLFFGAVCVSAMPIFLFMYQLFSLRRRASIISLWFLFAVRAFVPQAYRSLPFADTLPCRHCDVLWCFFVKELKNKSPFFVSLRFYPCLFVTTRMNLSATLMQLSQWECSQWHSQSFPLVCMELTISIYAFREISNVTNVAFLLYTCPKCWLKITRYNLTN